MFIPNQGRWMLSVQQQGFIYLFYYQFEKKKITYNVMMMQKGSNPQLGSINIFSHIQAN